MLEEGVPVKEGEGNRQLQHRALMSSRALQASRSVSGSVVQMRKLSLEKLCLQVQSVPLPERAAPRTNVYIDIQILGTGLGGVG